MALEEIRALWDAIDRAGTENVRVIFRTAGKNSPLENDELVPLLQGMASRPGTKRGRIRAGPFGSLWWVSLL